MIRLGTRRAHSDRSSHERHWTICDRRVRDDQTLLRYETFIADETRCEECIHAIGKAIYEITAAAERNT